MPRPKKYDWEDKREICYKLFVEERLSATQIVKYFAKHFNIPESELPDRNQFHNHFRQWGFPRRRERMPPETEQRLLARTRELFNQNLLVKDIQKTLNDEGWDMDNYHFRTFRKKHGMRMRGALAYRPEIKPTRIQKNKKKQTDGQRDGDVDEDDEAVNGSEQQSQAPALPPEEEARRAQRLADLQAQSDHLLQTRKRRRRIRGYGHLPADDPNLPPRYGSETSLDECKAILHLSNEAYVDIRTQYDAICREMGIVKMSLCQEGQWQESKDRLVRENMHLSSMLHPLQPDLDKRSNAVNCICSDVTKRMRNEGKTLTIAEANNTLGLDPFESKNIRRLLYDILEADHFTTVVACGKEHIAKLRDQWYTKSDVLQEAVACADPQKMRAIDLLNKDARKRYCDDQLRKHPDKKQWQKQKHYGPGPGPAQGLPRGKNGTALPNSNTASQPLTPARTRKRDFIPLGPAWEGHEQPDMRILTIADAVPPIDFDLDPLLHPRYGPIWPPTSSEPAQASQPAPASTAIPAYFRLAPSPQIVGSHPKMWLGKLMSRSVDALHQAATSKSGASKVVKVHGIVKNEDGSEDSWLIEQDDELSVYLDEAREKATFVVVLHGGYA